MSILSKNHRHLLKSIKIQLFSSSYDLKVFGSGFSTASIKQDQLVQPQLIVEYLINSCGLSLKEASQASKSISHIKSFTNPDAVINFLKCRGFSNADIKNLVATEPNLLCSNVEKNLELKFKAFEKIGLSEPEVAELIIKNPRVVQCGDAYHKLELFKEIAGSNQEMIRMCKRMNRIITYSLHNSFLPIVSLLRECGVLDSQIAVVLRFDPWIISYPINFLKERVERANEFGIPCKSRMFIYLLSSLCLNTKEELNAKIRLLKSFGWSEVEVLSAIRKSPQILRFNEGALGKRMGSLLKETACEPSYVARYPVLLGHSLKKRISPRLLVLRKLKHKGFKMPDLYRTIRFSDEMFKERFVLRYLHEIPGLLEVFTAACSDNEQISS